MDDHDSIRGELNLERQVSLINFKVVEGLKELDQIGDLWRKRRRE